MNLTKKIFFKIIAKTKIAIFLSLIFFASWSAWGCETRFNIEFEINKVKLVTDEKLFTDKRKVVTDFYGKDMGYDGLYDENFSLKSSFKQDSNNCFEVVNFEVKINPYLFISKKYSQTSCQYNRILNHELNHHKFVLNSLGILKNEFNNLILTHIKKVGLETDGKTAYENIKRIQNNIIKNYKHYTKIADDSIDNENNYYYESSLCFKSGKTIDKDEYLLSLSNIEKKVNKEVIVRMK